MSHKVHQYDTYEMEKNSEKKIRLPGLIFCY